MNSLYIKSLKTVFKNRQLFTLISNNFATKKTTKPTSGSDVEADKSKKGVRSSGNSESEPTSSTSQSKSSQSENVQGNIKEIKSVDGHKAPFSEDTISGRYAQTLFIASSQAGDLFNVYSDMLYLTSLYEKSEQFQTFAANAGLNSNQLFTFSSELANCGSFCKTSLAFLDLLAKNKRYMYVNDIAKKYVRAYHMLTKEEKITIISASDLNSSQKEQVKEAIKANPENSNKTFIIDFSVNPSIVGGLQMYSENRFMDLSLNSRIDKLKDEVNKYI